jgi:hypothetical protein
MYEKKRRNILRDSNVVAINHGWCAILWDDQKQKECVSMDSSRWGCQPQFVLHRLDLALGYMCVHATQLNSAH